jgi:hypothetical protein
VTYFSICALSGSNLRHVEVIAQIRELYGAVPIGSFEARRTKSS